MAAAGRRRLLDAVRRSDCRAQACGPGRWGWRRLTCPACDPSTCKRSVQSHLGEQVERALRRAGINPARRLEVETADTLTTRVAGGIGRAIMTPLCLLQGARSAAAVRHDFVPELHAERQFYLHVRKGEYDELGKETFELAAPVLDGQVRSELKAIHPSLSGLIQLHPWNDPA